MRKSGILMPVFSIPSKYGIGTMGKEAYQFIDFLEASKQSYWQILPLGQTSYGDSPYQSFSTFACNPYFIDLEQLVELGLLTIEECEREDATVCLESVDYEKIYHTRYQLLRLAYSRAEYSQEKSYQRFMKKNKKWIEDYALFMAIKDEQGGCSWQQWPQALRLRNAAILETKRHTLRTNIQFYYFTQYIFDQQWNKLRAYANKKGIQIIGDIPIYVAEDSADAWKNPELFQFDENLNPTLVAGCPPDCFSPTGQLWGNPLYNWQKHQETGYQWWMDRMEQCGNLCDIVRIDHFRGFDEYYAIPATDETAENGTWEQGPGIELFEAMAPVMEKLEIIAEDLGFITESVVELVKKTGFPNMKILQCGFDPYADSEFLPHNYHKNTVVYTGTHDNETIVGWYRNQDEQTKEFVQAYLDLSVDHVRKRVAEEEIAWKLIRLAMMSPADICIIPMQDYLLLDNTARINQPSTLGMNWKWRMKKDAITPQLVEKIADLVKISARNNVTLDIAINKV